MLENINKSINQSIIISAIGSNAGGYTPADDANVVGWFPASNNQGQFWINGVSGGDPAEQALTAKQGVVIPNGIGAYPIWRSDGINDTYALPASLYGIPNGANSIICVVKRFAVSVNEVIVAMTNGGGLAYTLAMTTGTTSKVSFINNGAGAAVESSDTLSDFSIVEGVFDGTNLQTLVIDGVVIDTDTNGADVAGVTSAFIASNNDSGLFAKADFADMAFLNTGNADVRGRVREYYSEKYGITLP